MRSSVEPARGGVNRLMTSLALAMLLAWTSSAVSASESTAPAARPSEAQVRTAVAKLAQDPLLGRKERVRTLQWKSQTEHKPANGAAGVSWLGWLAGALGWLATTARTLLWVIGIVLAGILGVYIKRFLALRGAGPSSRPIAMPTHVQDLDIRPELLPDDIGGSALGIWERGEHRIALALLYRGALSRLAHVHGAPILDASTEGDCLKLANAHLLAQSAAYTARLIRVWQRAVYGNADPSDDDMRALCGGFAQALDKSLSTLVRTA